MLLDTETFTQRSFLHRDTFTQRSLCAEQLLQTEAFTVTELPLHAET